MILGIGVDIVAVDRFEGWEDYPQERLQKVFSAYELAECMTSVSHPLEDAQKKHLRMYFASRFAAKEAFYKALSASLIKLGLTQTDISFALVRQHIEVIKPTWEVPEFRVHWQALEGKIGARLPELNVDLSLSHEHSMAIAFVVISQ